MSSHHDHYTRGGEYTYREHVYKYDTGSGLKHTRLTIVGRQVSDGRASQQHLMAEKLAAYRRRGFLIRDRVKALGLDTE